tara:strand:+ start:621 stop:911 length:291 start_codon:yes stop_codon:yes gene_type:complete
VAVNNNISNQQASITWLQLIMSLWFAISITFGFTTVYKDLQNDIDKTEQLKLEILDAREQSKRRIKNAEERILLKQEIEHLKIKNQLVFVDKVEKP